jgi:hypothetical protein
VGLVPLILAATSVAASPSVQVESRQPVVVRGVAFVAHERVTVTVAAGDKRAKVQAVADARGRFRARTRLAAGRCVDLVVGARGSAGSRARIVLRHPDCLPPDRVSEDGATGTAATWRSTSPSSPKSSTKSPPSSFPTAK